MDKRGDAGRRQAPRPELCPPPAVPPRWPPPRRRAAVPGLSGSEPGHHQGCGAPRGALEARESREMLGVISTFIIPGIDNLLILRKKSLLSGRIIPSHREFTG